MDEDDERVIADALAGAINEALKQRDELLEALEGMMKVACDLIAYPEPGDDYPEYHKAKALIARIKGK